MAEIETILQQLTGDLEPVAIVAQRLIGQDSFVDPVSGGAFMSHRPQIAPQAYALRIYPGLNEDVIAAYENIHSISICSTYREVLTKMNGAHLFGLSLFGVPAPMAKRPPLLDRSAVWPFDIATGQKDWRSPYRAPAGWFFLGYGPFSETEDVGYFITPDDRVEAVLKGGKSVERWSSIRSMLEHELARAETVYLS